MMQAMILAAGLGTRLLPYTRICPKPLFSIDRQPILHRTIMKLIGDGFSDILVNTHHLALDVQNFILSQNYAGTVQVCHEPKILGTGGGINNMLKQAASVPILVVNSDIVTDLNFKHIYDIHNSHDDPVTLILHDEPQYNTVRVLNNTVVSFKTNDTNDTLKAFTGIHVIDAIVGNYIPENKNYSIITAYEQMIHDGHRIHAHIVSNHYWADIGTPQGFAKASARMMSQTAFQTVEKKFHAQKLKGDGSDRFWWRYQSDEESMIMVDHGISRIAVPGINLKNIDKTPQSCLEVESFVKIGNHLHSCDVPVPKIIHYDLFSGIVFVEDLGDIHLQDYVSLMDEAHIKFAYQSVIDILIHMSTQAAVGFNSDWTCQTACYDAAMILKYECRYFAEAFLKNYLGINIAWSELEMEFSALTNAAITNTQWGFMHRDFQSRNIMRTKDQFYVIDFQGGRWGPIQYDLASLLIDPYVGLSEYLQDELLAYCLDQYSRIIDIDSHSFIQTYHYCRLFRNFQMLGAFAFLSKTKGKKSFEQYIPPALERLRQEVENWSFVACPTIIDCILEKGL